MLLMYQFIYFAKIITTIFSAYIRSFACKSFNGSKHLCSLLLWFQSQHLPQHKALPNNITNGSMRMAQPTTPRHHRLQKRKNTVKWILMVVHVALLAHPYRTMQRHSLKIMQHRIMLNKLSTFLLSNLKVHL